MKMKTPKTALDASTREEILNMAQKVFAEVGFKEATVRQICKAAKANVCLISYYFGGKDGLYNAVFDRVGQDRIEQMRSFLGNSGAITTAADYRLRLQLFLEAFHKEISSKPDFFKMVHREITDGMPRSENVIKNYIGTCRQIFVDFLEAGQKQKFIKKDLDSQFAAMCVINMLTGFLQQQLNCSDFFFKGINSKDVSEKILKTVSTIFFEGVL